MRRLMIAGATSGVGKTTLTCALAAAFRRRGRRVQPFKVGPDYIDPSHLSRAAGLPARNLDSFILPLPALRTLFAASSAAADLALIEGVMGLFDGRTGGDETGSTAQVAKLFDAPVVVVLDVAKTMRSAGAIALGYQRFDPAVHVAGFILNRVASETHAAGCREAVEAATGLPVLGSFPKREEYHLLERHLGLVPTAEGGPAAEFFDRLASDAEARVDLDRLWQLAASRPLPVVDDTLFPAAPVPRRAAIAVARDAAFNFYYQDSLDLLQAWGAEIVPFSPLRDSRLPDGALGIYLGGGFPELYAAELAANEPMHRALAAAGRAGLPIYAECGGLMYLGRHLTDFEGRCHAMAGLIPLESTMQSRQISVGYRTATALQPSPLLAAGQTVRGHEFHWSRLSAPLPEAQAAYRVEEQGGRPEGYVCGNVLASYIHLHFGADIRLAQRLIETAARVADDRNS